MQSRIAKLISTAVKIGSVLLVPGMIHFRQLTQPRDAGSLIVDRVQINSSARLLADSLQTLATSQNPIS